MSSLDYGDLLDTYLRGPLAKVLVPQFIIHQMFVGFSCSSLVLDEDLVAFMPQETRVDIVL